MAAGGKKKEGEERERSGGRRERHKRDESFCSGENRDVASCSC